MQASDLPTRVAMDCSGFSDIGKRRSVNSDQYFIADPSSERVVCSLNCPHPDYWPPGGARLPRLLLIADGIGEESGRLASSIAVEQISQAFFELLTANANNVNRVSDFKKRAVAAMEASRAEMRSIVQGGGSEHAELASTATMMFVDWPMGIVVHVGDCRAYLFRDSHLTRLTTDHTFAQRMLESGILEADRVADSRWNNAIWNAVSSNTSTMQPEINELQMQVGDSLLLCSDGLTKHIPDDALVDLMRPELSAETACRRLVMAALDAGGTDNITAVVARFSNGR